MVADDATQLLVQETRALLTRLARVRPFALHETMVSAAAIPPPAQFAVERYLAGGRQALRQQILDYLRWVQGPDGAGANPEEGQRRFAFLRLQFNVVLAQFDLFSNVFTQRSEHGTGVWLSGLDVAAADALALPDYYEAPPVICYLDRGVGAAIRRARTRLPGGGENPVAIIRVPRERMVGSGIASSLVHEVGHQAAALLGLVDSLQPALRERWKQDGGDPASPWYSWKRWISEIVADAWSVARVGVGSTLGLIGVVSLPRAFVVRMSLDEPHPFPWIRVKLSCALGQALYPHPQWERLAALWEAFYPLDDLDPERRGLIRGLEAGMPDFVSFLLEHRPGALGGAPLAAVLAAPERQPARLAALYERWRSMPYTAVQTPPTLAFAAIGQAKADGKLSPEAEGRMLDRLLTHWALSNTLNPTAHCAPPVRLSAPAT